MKESILSREDTARFAERREMLRSLMEGERLKALLVTLDANRYYLSGFELHDAQPDESSGCLVIMDDGEDLLCTDSRYLDAAKRLWKEENIFIYKAKPAESISEMLHAKVGSKKIGYDARHLSVSFFNGLTLPGLQRADGLVEELRIIKDPSEIIALDSSFVVNERMMQWLPSTLLPGKTEAAIAWEIEQFFRNNGAEELAFSSIVAVDGNGALPHAIPGQTAITENCSVLVDVGCRKSSYCSDQTRTFWVGSKPTGVFLEALEKVQLAQQCAIAAIKPGVTGAEIYSVAYDSLKKNGVAEYFTHGLGHGVGLQTHEAPRLSPSESRILAPGMVVTVEPGVYFSGVLGIRWEHTVVVTEDGCRILGEDC